MKHALLASGLGRVERPQAASKSLEVIPREARNLQSARKEESELRFEVNGQMFFVNFIPEEGRWYCYAPTATGVQRIPVSMDASPFEAFTVAVDEQEKEVVN
jgi:hypothetical protein